MNIMTYRATEIYGFKLQVALKGRNIYIENIRVVLLMDGLKIEGCI